MSRDAVERGVFAVVAQAGDELEAVLLELEDLEVREGALPPRAERFRRAATELLLHYRPGR